MPKIKLTESYIRSLEPEEKRYEVMDTECRNLGIRIGTNGKKSYIFYSRWPGGGRHPSRALLGEHPGMSLLDARKKSALWHEQIRKGVDPREDTEIEVVDRRLWAVRTVDGKEAIGVWYCEEKELFDLIDNHADPYGYEYREVVPDHHEGMVFNFFGGSRETTMGVERSDYANHMYHITEDVNLDWEGEDSNMLHGLFFNQCDQSWSPIDDAESFLNRLDTGA